jgi:ABC-2 type transport system permease protein
LNFSRQAARLRHVARLSWLDYRVVYTPRVLALGILPRALLQVLFISYLGYYAAGEAGRTFAFVGASAQVMAMPAIVKGMDAIYDERVMGTMYRQRLGVVPLPLTVLARWSVYAVEAFVIAALTVVVLGAFIGGPDLLGRLVMALPLYALLACTLSAFGLLVGSIALTQRTDVVVSNVASYLLLAFCGVVAPVAALGAVASELVRALPLTNGLLGIRALVDGQAWWSFALWELFVGVVWFGLAAAALAWQQSRARRLGKDDKL